MEYGEYMRFKGIVDNVNDCDCCGKTGLVKTVALETNGGEVVYYGVTCASVALGYGKEFTTRNAHKLAERVELREKYAKLLASAMASAQEKANASQKIQVVLFKKDKYHKLGWYSVMDAEQWYEFNSIQFGDKRAIVSPNN
jgi:hypothetical protein